MISANEMGRYTNELERTGQVCVWRTKEGDGACRQFVDLSAWCIMARPDDGRIGETNLDLVDFRSVMVGGAHRTPTT